ncbi:DUF3892 domain-containing protein [Pseudonocardia nematodicida]|uniref:DUF3892 domain-containing protein n=1 Tax=Pseudonocardia nematodicida TaxID=1206997 RepID=A0ABV1K5C1_9PSEU
MSERSHGNFDRAVEISSDLLTVLTRLQLPPSLLSTFELPVSLPSTIAGGSELFTLTVDAQIALTIESAYTSLHPDYGRLPGTKIERLADGYRVQTRTGKKTLPYTRPAYPGKLTFRIGFDALLVAGSISIPALGVTEPLSDAIDRVLGAGLGKELVTFGVEGLLWLDGDLLAAPRTVRIDPDLPPTGGNLAHDVPVALIGTTGIGAAVVDASVVDSNLFFLALIDLAEGIAQMVGASPAQVATLDRFLREQLVGALEGALSSAGPALLAGLGGGPGSGTDPGEFMLYRPTTAVLVSGEAPQQVDVAATGNGFVLLMNDVENPDSDPALIDDSKVESQDPAQMVASSLLSRTGAMAVTVGNAALLSMVAESVEKSLGAGPGSLSGPPGAGLSSATLPYSDGTAVPTISGVRQSTGQEIQIAVAVDTAPIGGAVEVRSYLELGITFAGSLGRKGSDNVLVITPRFRRFTRSRTTAKWWAFVVAAVAAPAVAPLLGAVPVVGAIFPVVAPTLHLLTGVGAVLAVRAIVDGVADAATTAAAAAVTADAQTSGLIQKVVPLSASAALTSDSRDDDAVTTSGVTTLPSSTTDHGEALRSRPDLVVLVGFRAIDDDDSDVTAPVGVVTCRVPDPSGSPDRRIDALEIRLANDVHTRLDLDSAIELVENGHLVLLIESAGPPGRNKLVVRRSRSGTPYLTTNPNSTTLDNLGEVPVCHDQT